MSAELIIRERHESKIESAMVIFTNSNNIYPIRGIQDNIQDVSYRSVHLGLDGSKSFSEWLREAKNNDEDDNQRDQIIWMDIVNSHQQTSEAWEALDTNIYHLPVNGGHKCQPLDFSVIKLFEDIWREVWMKNWNLLRKMDGFLLES